MDYYSIRATDIHLKKLNSTEGWHIGDAVNYLVQNGSWISHIRLLPVFNEYGRENFTAQLIYISGDKNKLLNNSDTILLALRENLKNQNISLMQPVQL